MRSSSATQTGRTAIRTPRASAATAVSFRSQASNLVPGDANGVSDAFIRDRRLGTTIRLSMSSTGIPGNDYTYRPQLEPSGRFIVSRSRASNLVPNDTNGQVDVFVRDLATGVTTRVSMSSEHEQANGPPLLRPWISADGRFVVFGSDASNMVRHDTNHTADVFLRDRRTAKTTRISVGPAGQQMNLASGEARISASGRTIACTSDASNLVTGDRNRARDVFIVDASPCPSDERK